MDQKRHQKQDIEVGQDTAKESRDTPEESGRYLWDVVEVTRHSPPAGEEEKPGLLLTSGGVIGGFDGLGRPAPDGAVALGVAHMFLLVVCIVVDVDGSDASEEDEKSEGKPQVIRVMGEVEGVAGVDRGDPHQTAPTLHTEGREKEELK